MTLSKVRTLFTVGLMLLSSPHWARAKGGSNISVVTTASVSGTAVQGAVTITNATSKAVTVTAVRNALEVRFPVGYPIPALPAGYSTDYYLVATINLPVPGPIPALGSVSVPYSIDICGNQIAGYTGAKDMRSVGLVTSGGRVVQERSDNFVPPYKSSCPVCGNRIREATEQCDGSACCTATCQYSTNGTGCNDGDACTQTDQCQTGSCLGGNPVACVATGQCRIAGTCAPATGVCSTPAKPNGTTCDDGSACSTGDACTNGICMGAPLACGDDNPCTTDACAAGSCLHFPNSDPCEDGSICTDGDTCADGACLGGVVLDCDDHKVCTDDTCQEDIGCAHTATPTCDGCYADECVACHDTCTADNAQCAANCWEGFFACVNACTSTYCAPFCQVSLGYCLNACPSDATCFPGCDVGNGCAAGCTQP